MKSNLNLIIAGFFMILGPLVFSQVGVGTSTPDTSAMLDISSSEKGLLPPRMTEPQRDAINGGNPAAGLVIYNKDTNCLEYWNSSKWVSQCQPELVIPPLTTGLNCGGLITGVFTDNVYASTSKSISYISGNGASYDSMSFNSTGVTGLTLNAPAGVLANGNGNIMFTLSGTPIGSGTASFNVNVGGHSCQFNVEVESVDLTTWVDETVVNNEKSLYIHNPSGLPVTADFHVSHNRSAYPVALAPFWINDNEGTSTIISGEIYSLYRMGTLSIPAEGTLRISITIRDDFPILLQWDPDVNIRTYDVQLYKTNVGVSVLTSADKVLIQGNNILNAYYN